MPLIVDPADYDVWMDRHVHEAWVLGGVMQPFPSERMGAGHNLAGRFTRGLAIAHAGSGQRREILILK